MKLICNQYKTCLNFFCNHIKEHDEKVLYRCEEGYCPCSTELVKCEITIIEQRKLKLNKLNENCKFYKN